MDAAASGIGLFSLAPDLTTDGIIRRVKLLTGANGNYYPILGAEVLRVVQGAGSFKLKSSDGSNETNFGRLRMTSVQVGGVVIPTDAEGNMPIYHSPSSAKPVISVRHLLESPERVLGNRELRKAVENHIVLIGTSATGLFDLRVTPAEPVVPGVLIHADIIDQIVSASFLTRPDDAKGRELLAAIIFVCLFLAFLPFVRSLVAAIFAISLILFAVWFCWHQFSSNLLLLNPALPIVSVALVYITSSATLFLASENETQFLKGAFSQYLSPELVNELARNPDQLKLGGEDKELTILFCDIRKFTSISESMKPSELTKLLNDFLTPMTDILLENGATIDKYMGDAIMAFWNAPIDQPNHRELACKSVQDMRDALTIINNKHKLDLQIGIGIYTGWACVGNLGSEKRFNYSVIGDSVNLASRIEGLTKNYDLDCLIAKETLAGDHVETALEIDLVRVVGRSEPITVYTLPALTGFSDKKLQEFRTSHANMIIAYRQAQLKTASHLLDELKAMSPPSLMAVYDQYSSRVMHLNDHGIPANWDGVFVAQSK